MSDAGAGLRGKVEKKQRGPNDLADRPKKKNWLEKKRKVDNLAMYGRDIKLLRECSESMPH